MILKIVIIDGGTAASSLMIMIVVLYFYHHYNVIPLLPSSIDDKTAVMVTMNKQMADD
jgi:hypothetical protein